MAATAICRFFFGGKAILKPNGKGQCQHRYRQAGWSVACWRGGKDQAQLSQLASKAPVIYTTTRRNGSPHPDKPWATVRTVRQITPRACAG
jgi:hypothetical protein